MRYMSFSMTTPQVRAKQKDVTRRIGWSNLLPGDKLWAIEKGQGLKKGETVTRICIIEIVHRTSEQIQAILDDKIYPDPAEEMKREGFPGMEPIEFLRMFCKANNCSPSEWINRIEFKYV